MTTLESFIESKLAELGIKNIQFRHAYADFLCEGKRVRCVYRSDYPDPRECEWDISMLDQKLINQHVLVFTLEREPVFRLSGEDICCCFTLMARTRVIASFLRVLQLQVNAARRDVAALMSNCATYQEASEMLKHRPQLCADAKGKNLLPRLWAR
jgi:hypothetical protein